MRSFILSWLCLGLATLCAASPDEIVPFDQAQFVYSTNPAKVVLSIAIEGMTPARSLFTLYGDGRLTRLEFWGNDEKVRTEVTLTADQLKDLLGIAVTHGLAEWDLTRVQDQQIARIGQLYVAPDDESRILILLSLTEYRRGEFYRAPVEEKIRFSGAAFFSRRLPKIPEIEGIQKLNAETSRLSKGQP
jgi:hypothetical protein